MHLTVGVSCRGHFQPRRGGRGEGLGSPAAVRAQPEIPYDSLGRLQLLLQSAAATADPGIPQSTSSLVIGVISGDR